MIPFRLDNITVIYIYRGLGREQPPNQFKICVHCCLWRPFGKMPGKPIHHIDLSVILL